MTCSCWGTLPMPAREYRVCSDNDMIHEKTVSGDTSTFSPTRSGRARDLNSEGDGVLDGRGFFIRSDRDVPVGKSFRSSTFRNVFLFCHKTEVKRITTNKRHAHSSDDNTNPSTTAQPDPAQRPNIQHTDTPDCVDESRRVKHIKESVRLAGTLRNNLILEQQAQRTSRTLLR